MSMKNGDITLPQYKFTSPFTFSINLPELLFTWNEYELLTYFLKSLIEVLYNIPLLYLEFNQERYTKYKNFGGVYNWEYFNSPPSIYNPALWSICMSNEINKFR